MIQYRSVDDNFPAGIPRGEQGYSRRSSHKPHLG